MLVALWPRRWVRDREPLDPEPCKRDFDALEQRLDRLEREVLRPSPSAPSLPSSGHLDPGNASSSNGGGAGGGGGGAPGAGTAEQREGVSGASGTFSSRLRLYRRPSEEEGGTEEGGGGGGGAEGRPLELSPDQCLELLGALNAEVGARLARHLVNSSLMPLAR